MLSLSDGNGAANIVLDFIRIKASTPTLQTRLLYTHRLHKPCCLNFTGPLTWLGCGSGTCDSVEGSKLPYTPAGEVHVVLLARWWPQHPGRMLHLPTAVAVPTYMLELLSALATFH